MPTTTDPNTPTATLAAARHFATEMVQVHPCGRNDPSEAFVAFRIDGRHPKGWALLGPSVIVTIEAGGTTTISDDDQ